MPIRGVRSPGPCTQGGLGPTEVEGDAGPARGLCGAVSPQILPGRLLTDLRALQREEGERPENSPPHVVLGCTSGGLSKCRWCGVGPPPGCAPVGRLHPESGSRVSLLELLTFGTRLFFGAGCGGPPLPWSVFSSILASAHYLWVATPSSLSCDKQIGLQTRPSCPQRGRIDPCEPLGAGGAGGSRMVPKHSTPRKLWSLLGVGMGGGGKAGGEGFFLPHPPPEPLGQESKWANRE